MQRPEVGGSVSPCVRWKHCPVGGTVPRGERAGGQDVQDVMRLHPTAFAEAAWGGAVHRHLRRLRADAAAEAAAAEAAYQTALAEQAAREAAARSRLPAVRRPVGPRNAASDAAYARRVEQLAAKAAKAQAAADAERLADEEPPL